MPGVGGGEASGGGLACGCVFDRVHCHRNSPRLQELKDYVAWLSSDSGKALVQKMPAVRAEILDRSTPMIAAMMPALQHKVAARVCEELKCTARERQTIAAIMAKALAAPRS